MKTAEVHKCVMNDMFWFLVHKSCINEWVHDMYLVCERNYNVYYQNDQLFMN